MLEEGQVRLGWSTNDASLILGTDSKGFGYGADKTGLFNKCTITLEIVHFFTMKH